MAICDAHAHPGEHEEQESRIRQGVRTFLCATDPQSAETVAAMCGGSELLIPTYGLHPWYADQFEVEQMLPYIDKGVLLGEIGMDSVWCEVLRPRQLAVFKEQLALAENRNIPVILHTKGEEKAILTCIEGFRPPILVHWYSAERYLEGYVEKDCFFSIGPDVQHNPAVQAVVKAVRPERLLVETDGMGAVRWAAQEYGQKDVSGEDGDAAAVLRRSMEYIAMVKGIDFAALERQLEENFMYLAKYRERDKLRR